MAAVVTNLDPKPGRWILPLVIVGMIAFTYFFVQALGGAEEVDSITTTSSITTTTEPSDTTETTLDPEVRQFLDSLTGAENEMTRLQTEMAEVNAGFDARPRTIEFEEADARLAQLAVDAHALADTLSVLGSPGSEEIATQHGVVVAAAGDVAARADDVLAGLRSTDTGEARQAAIAAFDAAVASFADSVLTLRGMLSE